MVFQNGSLWKCTLSEKKYTNGVEINTKKRGWWWMSVSSGLKIGLRILHQTTNRGPSTPAKNQETTCSLTKTDHVKACHDLLSSSHVPFPQIATCLPPSITVSHSGCAALGFHLFLGGQGSGLGLEGGGADLGELPASRLRCSVF